MSIKSIVIFLLILGGVVWYLGKTTQESPPAKPASLVAGQQKQMEKAANLGKQMQSDLDQRMKSNPQAE
jgi:hypothetical protein